MSEVAGDSFARGGADLRSRRRVPLPTPQVDLGRFMGAWYVLGGILTPVEALAANAVEHYELAADGTVTTRFRFRLGHPQGRFMEFGSRGFVTDDPSGSVWRMQFVAPLKLDYRIAFVDADYATTLVARERRDLLWIMARDPVVPPATFGGLVRRAAALGYDADRIRTVEQRWTR